MSSTTFTVALVGGDGAGKTTIAKRLIESGSLPMKYVYMGPSIESSNIALPTSRIVLALKLRSYKRRARRLENVPEGFLSTSYLEHQSVERGAIGAGLRLLNRTAEVWYRQIVAWGYQKRGYIVLYDRHFLFEAVPLRPSTKRWTDRLHYWHMDRIVPKPDLVIFLDAPPELLFSRKGEATLDLLERDRKKYLKQGSKLANFVRVDAAQPLDKVYSEVTDHLMSFHSRRQRAGG